MRRILIERLHRDAFVDLDVPGFAQPVEGNAPQQEAAGLVRQRGERVLVHVGVDLQVAQHEDLDGGAGRRLPEMDVCDRVGTIRNLLKKSAHGCVSYPCSRVRAALVS